MSLPVSLRARAEADLAAAIGILSWTFWTSPRVGAGMLAGAASVYLLGGYFWGEAFGPPEFLEPGSFHDACAPRPDGASACDATAASYPRLLYLSFVTITTLGYGDLLPVTRAAEGMATVAALTGQLFLAVMIGRVVGGYVSQDSDASTQ